MKIAYTSWTWIHAHNNDEGRWQLEQSFKELKAIGYDTVENFGFIADYYDDPKELVDMTKRVGVDLCNLYGHFNFDVEAALETAKKQVDFLAAIGGRWFNCQNGGFGDDGPIERPSDIEKLDITCEICNRLGEYAIKKGVKVCFHPHHGTCVFSQVFTVCCAPSTA